MAHALRGKTGKDDVEHGNAEPVKPMGHVKIRSNGVEIHMGCVKIKRFS